VVNAVVMFFARIIASMMRSSNDRGGGGSYLMVFVLEMVLGIFGMMITAWYSRQREFRADAGAASLAGRERMIGALRRLAGNRDMVDTSHEALATLKINGVRSWGALFSTHPPLEVRIAALERAGR